MDSKKKKKITISVVISILLVAVIAIGIFFGVKKINENKNSQNASNMSTTTQTNTYNEAIAKKQITQNYNGVYVYKSTYRVDPAKDLTQKDFEKVCINITSKPYVNDLISYLDTERKKVKTDSQEKLVFYNGLFNRNINDNPKDENSDRGDFYGNDNLALVEAQNGVFFISLNYADISNNIPVSDKQNKDKTKVYVIENVYSKENPKRVLFTVTYIYEMVDEEIKTIPDSELIPNI